MWIKTFEGTSANAFKIQIWTPLIAILVLKYLKVQSRNNCELINLVALLIKLDSSRPVFFVQKRVELNKRRFRLYKFPTLVDADDQKQAEFEAFNETCRPVFKIKNDPRITQINKFLRKINIDELPKLINVLKGDMSFVGP